jgi:histidinol-phosphate aminotransferase
MSRFWSDGVHDLTPYVPGEQPSAGQFIKLNTNENPYPPSKASLAAMRAAIDDRLGLYPDPDSVGLRSTIAQRYDVSREEVFVGNGSDEILAFAFQGLLKRQAPILFPDITYSFYPVYCRLYGVAYTEIPLSEDFTLRTDHYGGPCGGIIFPNPNAPTGLALGQDQIARLAASQPDVPVIIDEAYVDFGAQSAVPLVRQYPNLLVVQTLSKSRSLAGLRVGFAIGSPPLIEGLNRIKNSFNSYPLDRIAQAGAQAALEDADYFKDCCNGIVRNRQQLCDDLTRLGFELLPSLANFVLMRHPTRSATDLLQKLRAHNILVRHFKTPPRLAPFLRVSIGSAAQCAALVCALDRIMGGQSKSP